MEIDAFRFWIGSITERVSSVWRIWDQAGQVYLTSEAFGGTIKLSVHTPRESQPDSDFVCQFGFTETHRRERNIGRLVGGSPSFIRWKRKQAMPGEAHELARLYFPSDLLLTPQPVAAKPKRFQCFLEPAPAGKCILLQVIALAKPASEGDFWNAREPAKTVAHMPLGDNEQCILVFRKIDFDPSSLPLGKEINTPTEWLHPKLQSMSPGDETRDFSLAFWTHPNDFEAIHIAETSGLNLTMNSRKEVPR